MPLHPQRHPPERRARFLHRRRHREGRRLRLFALTVRYGQTHVQEMEASRRAARARCRATRVELDLDLRDIARSALTVPARCRWIATSRIQTTSEQRTSRPATPSSFPWRLHGPRPSAPPSSSSASTRWTTPGIPIAGPNTSRRSSAWAAWPRPQAYTARPCASWRPCSTCRRRTSSLAARRSGWTTASHIPATRRQPMAGRVVAATAVSCALTGSPRLGSRNPALERS